MFEIHSHTNYDNGINLGQAIVFMNRNNHLAKINVIYYIDEKDE